MNLLYGQIVEIFCEEGMLTGKIRIRRATKKMCLGLVAESRVGDWVLICDGIAIGRIENQTQTKMEG